MAAPAVTQTCILELPLRRKLIHAVLLAAWCLAPMPYAATATSVAPEFDVQIEPSRTWVGFARVHLEVMELRSTASALKGRYRIRVPLRPSRNDFGTLELHLTEPLDQLQQAGGQIEGSAHSDVNGKTRDVECKIRPGGRLDIQITTDERTLTFKTKYRPMPS